MRKWINIKTVWIGLLMIAALSCETDFPNPNSASEEEAFSSREGILAVTVGMKRDFSTTGLRFVIETPAITTREGGITTTFINMIELEDGGSTLPNFNTNVQGLWSSMLRVMYIGEQIEANIDNISLNAGTRSGLLAYAKLFRAMAIGNLANQYEQVVVATSNDNEAAFVPRAQAYAAAIGLLDEAAKLIEDTPISAEFENEILNGEMDLANVINAMLARYHLFAGNYEAAIAAAGSASLEMPSVFAYDALNPNPVFLRVIQGGAPNFKPRDNFGLPDELAPDPEDGRLAFYTIPLDELNQNGLPIEDLGGFFSTATSEIPVYLPDEMRLIRAEAHLRKASPDVGAALAEINAVRTNEDDIYGLNAGLAAYDGESTVEALLLEVYRNRRASLFLTGLSLEDSRRFDRPQPSTTPRVFTDERNRNFYPYPERERNNNPNTPPDPAI